MRDGRVVAVGTNADIQKLKENRTQVVDLGGRFVMPGFNDAHCHLASGGAEQMNVNLVGTKSLAEMQERVAAKTKTAAPNDWIIGGGWDHTLWPGQKLPPARTWTVLLPGIRHFSFASMAISRSPTQPPWAQRALRDRRRS